VNPRRAWALVAAVSVAILAGALALASAMERRARAAPRALDVPRVDAHQHAGPATVGAAVNLGSANGVLALVNASGGWIGDGLEAQIAAALRYPGRAGVLMDVDFQGCCGEAWAERETARLVQGRAAGARGVHVTGALGQTLRDAGGRRIAADAQALEPIWDIAGRLELPVVLHAMAPLEEHARLVERHPDLRFVGGGFAGLASDPAEASRLLDRLPNLHLDTAGVLRELARHAAAARDAVLAHPDRVLFATDLKWVEGPGDRRAVILPPEGPREPAAFYLGGWLLLETAGPVAPALAGPGGEPLEGLALPRDVLERVYHRNARQVFGLAAPEDLR
jgi:predicted TIM-barrel fold metal-dependent hydrolase